MSKEVIKDFYGKVVGTIETSGNKQIAKDFYGRIVGTYDSSSNITKDFYGKIVGRGNVLAGLLFSSKR